MREALTIGLLFSGLFFFTVGTVGLIRLPDLYCRLHASTKSDTLGIGLILAGLLVHAGISSEFVKLLFMLIFVWVTNPTAGHLIARAAYDTGLRGVPTSEVDLREGEK